MYDSSVSLTPFVLGFVAGILLVPAVSAQQTPTFTLGGEIRERSELDARDFDADTSPADVHLLRTRLNVAVDPVDRVDVFLEIQDSRRFGAGDPALARGTMDPSAGVLDLHQGYFRVRRLLDAPLSLKVGRQELAYGTQRLVGAVGWSNVGRTFDAGVLSYEGGSVSADLFAARLVSTTAEGDGSQNLFGLYGTWEPAEGHQLDVFALLDNDTNEVPDEEGDSVNRLVRLTPGVTLRGALSRVRYELEAAYQTGRKAVEDGTDRSTIRASLLSGYASYPIVPARDVRIGAGYTRLSGDEAPEDETLGQFTTLFATNHKFYGFMDLFPGTAERFGLQDAHLTTSVRLAERVHLAAAVHHFVQVEPRPSRPGRTLGQELDLTLTYRFAAPMTVSAGLSGFRPDDAMEAALGTDDPAYWAYLMSTITF